MSHHSCTSPYCPECLNGYVPPAPPTPAPAPTFEALRDAATALYLAGAWRCDTLPPDVQARMWEALRDALGLPVGTATAAGVGLADLKTGPLP